MGYVIQEAAPHNIARIFEISSALHRFRYEQFIDDEHKPAFFAHYQASHQNEERFAQVVLRKLADPSYTFLVLLVDDLVVGYVAVQQDDNRRATLHALFVDEAYQGKGYGAALLSEVVQRFDDMQLTLEVIAKNKRAIRLYEKFHFTPVATPANATYYGARLLYMARAPHALSMDI